MTGFCRKCGRKIISPQMIFNKFGGWHRPSYKKGIEIEERYKKGLCAKCFKEFKKRVE